MLLEVVIVSFNTRELLKDCLESLFKNLEKEKIRGESRVTVVDNNSGDGSAEMVIKDFPRVKLIRNRENTGFAKANNQAIRVSNANFILLLNSDTRVLPGAISGLLKEISKDPEIKAAGPRLLNFDGSLQQSFGFAPTLVRVLFWMMFIDDLPGVSRLFEAYHIQEKSWYEKRRYVDWVSGAVLLFRRDIIKLVGLLDEKIFMYGEEVEWCYRVRKTGGKILYFPKASIIHLGGGSQKGPGQNILREFQSIVYFYGKYYPAKVPLVRLLLKAGALLRLILFGIIGHSSPRFTLYAKAFKVA